MYKKAKEIYSVKLLTRNDVIKLAIFIQKHIFQKVSYYDRIKLSDMIDEIQMLIDSSSTKHISVFYREESKNFTYSIEIEEPIIKDVANIKVIEYGYDVFEFCKTIKNSFNKEFDFEEARAIKIKNLKKLTKVITILQKYINKDERSNLEKSFFKNYDENNFDDFYIFIEIRKRMLTSITWGVYNYDIRDFIKIKELDEYIKIRVDGVDE